MENDVGRQCDICEGRLHQRFASVRGSQFALYSCTRCGTETLHPKPTWEEIRAIYDSSYYKSWGMSKGETPAVANMKKHTFARRIKQIKRFVSEGRILDVGTASGFFLEVALAAGFEAYGVELSQYSGQLATDKFGEDRIHIGTLETAPFGSEMFDVIAMSDLIEHVAEPLETLRIATRLLRPGGVILIMTPNASSLSHFLMGRNWTHYKVEHLTYFSHEGMRRAAGLVGLKLPYIHPAVKTLTMRYIHTQFETYPHWFFTPVTRTVIKLLPVAADWPVPVIIGEFVAILQKPASAAQSR